MDERAVRFNIVGVGFLLVELDTAWTFARLARTNPAHERRSYLTTQAERAFREALHWRPQLYLTEAENLRFQERCSTLESELAQLAWELAFDRGERDAA